MRLGEYLCVRLSEAGCKHVFGVPGDFNLGLLNCVMDNEELEYVGCCNELNAAYAADGAARVAGGLAALITTYSVGELSAVNGVAGAYAESVPIVHLVGTPARKFYKSKTLLHHTFGNDYYGPQRIATNITCAQCLLDNMDTAVAEIDRCLNACYTNKQPVYIAVPSDMVNANVDAALKCALTRAVSASGGDGSPLSGAAREVKHIPWTPPPAIESNPDVLNEAITEIVQRIQSSKRPLFIPGVELIRRQLQPLFEQLTNKSNIPYVTMLLSKGLLSEDHPNFIGLYMGDRSHLEIQDVVAKSDCVVVIGEKFTDFNTGGFTADISSFLSTVINYDHVQISCHMYQGIFIEEVLRALVERVPVFPKPAYDYPKAAQGCILSKDSVIDDSTDRKLTMREVFKRFVRDLPPRCVLIAETGSSMFAAAESMLPTGSLYIGQTFYGSIGYTVGACLGACLEGKRTNRRVYLVVGDGSFQLTCQEVSTMIRYKCDPVILVINNDGYLIERVITDHTYNDIQRWKYSTLPPVFGGEMGKCCETTSQFRQALEDVEKHPEKLHFIEVVLEKWDCNKLLKAAGRMMALNNGLEPSITPEMLAEDDAASLIK